MTPTHDTAAALWSAIDAYGCDAASHGALGKDATTRAAIEASAKPVLITHAGCAAVHANPRNKTDDQLRAIAEKGGVFGIFLNRKNLIVLLMAIELMLLAVNMNFVAFSHYLGDLHGQVFVFFILTVAAAESAIGLAILVLLFRNKSSINVDELNTLKG